MGNRLKEAEAFAEKLHQGQKRKGSVQDYIVHPRRVYEIVAAICDDEDVQIAALLHDVLEDTVAVEEVIQEKFGARVLRIVKEVSTTKEDKKNKSWVERKKDTIISIYNQSEEAQIVEVADKLSNAEDFYQLHDENGVIHFDSFHEKDVEKQEWYYRNLYEAFRDYGKNDNIKEVAERLRECTDFGFGRSYEEYLMASPSPVLVEVVSLLKDDEDFLESIYQYLNEQGIRTCLHRLSTRLENKVLAEQIDIIKIIDKDCDVVLVDSGTIYRRMTILEKYQTEKAREPSSVYETLEQLGELSEGSKGLDGAVGIYNDGSDRARLKALTGAFTNLSDKPIVANINVCMLNKDDSRRRVAEFIVGHYAMTVTKSEMEEKTGPHFQKKI